MVDVQIDYVVSGGMVLVAMGAIIWVLVSGAVGPLKRQGRCQAGLSHLTLNPDIGKHPITDKMPLGKNQD